MNQLPAYLQNRPSRQLAQALTANLGTGSPPYVSIKGNRFTLIDATGAEEAVPTFSPQADQFGVIGPYLDCVIIDLNEHTSKVFYDKAYDPSQEGQQPACWSDNGVAPSRGAQTPQSQACNICPMNIWGSATSKISGKGVKACHDVQKIAVMIPDDDVIFLMRVPPNSRTNLRDYTLKFLGQQIDIPDVVTRISFDQQTLGTLQFVAVGFIPEGEMQRRDGFLAEKKTDALVGRTDQPITGAIAAQPAAALPAPAGQFVQGAGAPVQTAAAPLANAQPAGQPFMQPVQQQVQQPAMQGGAAQPASHSEQAPKTRKRRQTAQAQPEGIQQAGPASAPFRTDAPPTQPAQPAGAAFGIQPGVAPNLELTSVLTGIFGANR